MTVGHLLNCKLVHRSMGLFLVISGLAEGWEQLKHLGTHHGVIVIGLYHLLHTGREVHQNLDHIDDDYMDPNAPGADNNSPS